MLNLQDMSYIVTCVTGGDTSFLSQSPWIASRDIKRRVDIYNPISSSTTWRRKNLTNESSKMDKKSREIYNENR